MTTTEKKDLQRQRKNYVALAESLGGVQAECLAADSGRWALVERNQGGHTPPYWLSRHDSPQEAETYHAGQEYAEDWQPTLLVDLDSNKQFEIYQTYGFDYAGEPPEEAR